MEAALAHIVRNQTEAAYARSDLFDRRRQLMNVWMKYLAPERERLSAIGGGDGFKHDVIPPHRPFGNPHSPPRLRPDALPACPL